MTRAAAAPIDSENCEAASRSPKGKALPALRKRLIGRGEQVAHIITRLQLGRLVTLSGYGGVGKTSVALAVGAAWERLADAEVLFIDLSRISDAAHLWTSVLAALDVTPLGDPRATVLRLLSESSLLILLDNCEHIVAEIADAASAILSHAPGVRILATSREDLRIGEEEVVRIEPLSVPRSAEAMSAADIVSHSAVELYLERVGARAGAQRSIAEAIQIARLCSRLDGVPLAIELAAARVRESSVSEVMQQLSSRFDVLSAEQTEQTSRHAGLLAVLDWSYELLTPAEQAALRSASVFTGEFTASDLSAVMRGSMSAAMISAALNGLAAKSMVQESGEGQLALLESTRAYAQRKLEEAGELRGALDALSNHVLRTLREAPRQDRDAALALWDRMRSDAAATIEWSLEGKGDRGCGIDIVTAALPTWLLLSEISRYAGELKTASQAIRTVAPQRRADELQIEFSRSIALYFERGPNQEGIEAGKHAYGIAVEIGALDRQLDTSWNLHAQTTHWGGYDDGLLYARRNLAAAKRAGDPILINQGWRVIARAFDDLGFHRRCERLFREVVQPNAGDTAKPVTAWGADERIIRICMDARVHWFAGRADTALEIAETAVQVGLQGGQAHTFCWMLAQHMVPIALWAGDSATAERYVEILAKVSEHHFDNWSTWGEMLREAIDVVHGERPSPALMAQLEESWPHRQDVFASLHPSLACEETLARASNPVRFSWSTPVIWSQLGCKAAADGDIETAKMWLTRARSLSEERGNVPLFRLAAEALLDLC